ncbi:MAG: DUF3343 domain-containing protein [Lutispora sp.]|nr:DUF3343 domain-containing protein [Lutispora sp.]
MEDLFCVIAFSNTHAAVTVQKTLSESGYRIFMMPTLREITAGCGLSVRFSPNDLSEIQKAVSYMNIEPSLHQFYMVDTRMGRCQISKLD